MALNSCQVKPDALGFLCPACSVLNRFVQGNRRHDFRCGVCGEPLKGNLLPSDVIDWQIAEEKQGFGDRKEVLWTDGFKMILEPTQKPPPLYPIYTSNKVVAMYLLLVGDKKCCLG